LAHVELYEIRIRGAEGSRLTEQFPRLKGAVDSPETVLVGPLRDQSELHALLSTVDYLDLELVEVRRVPGSLDSEELEDE
jgi:hypothetical protein